MAVPVHTPVVLLAAIVASSVAVFAWVYRDAPGARWLAAFMVGASLWALAEGVALASPALGGKTLWTQVAWSVSALVPLTWLGTVLASVDHQWRLTGRHLGVLLVEPLAFFGLVWTNADHGLVWSDIGTQLSGGTVVLTREFGLAFWAHTAYMYGLVAAGGAVLVVRMLDTSRPFRTQGTVLLVAVFVPLLANALTVFGLVSPQYDLTSIGFVVTGVIVAGAMYREEFMSVAPVTRDLGREAIVDEMDDGVVILDSEDRLVDLNPAAERLFDAPVERAVGRELAALSAPLADAVTGVTGQQGELELNGGADGGGHRFYDVRVSSLSRAYGAVTGRIVTLRDVSERRQREQRLDVLNRLLRHNLRNELNIVRGNATILADSVETDDPDVEQRLNTIVEMVDAIVDRSDKVGYLSDGVDDPTSVGLASVVDDAVVAVSRTASDATITVDVPADLTVLGSPSLERAVEELLANALEHGTEDPTVEVTATRSAEMAELRVSDDGPGIAEQERVVIEEGQETALKHGSGIGLWLVRWVVREHGGTVAFEDCSDGTTVVLGLPVAPNDGVSREQSTTESDERADTETPETGTGDTETPETGTGDTDPGVDRRN